MVWNFGWMFGDGRPKTEDGNGKLDVGCWMLVVGI